MHYSKFLLTSALAWGTAFAAILPGIASENPTNILSKRDSFSCDGNSQCGTLPNMLKFCDIAVHDNLRRGTGYIYRSSTYVFRSPEEFLQQLTPSKDQMLWRANAVPTALATDVASFWRAQAIVPAPEMTFGMGINRSVRPGAVSVGSKSSQARLAALASSRSTSSLGAQTQIRDVAQEVSGRWNLFGARSVSSIFGAAVLAWAILMD